jgi:hypothetical protein
MRRHFKMPSPAMAVALLALFVSLGGVGYAASRIGTKQIKNGAVTNAKIKNGAVGNHKIANGAVGNRKLADNSISTGKLQNGSVTASKLGTGVLSGANLTAASVGTTALADNAVTTNKLADRAVTTNKLADNAVNGQKVQDNSLTGNDIDESSLGQVPNAATLNGKGPGAFVSSSVFKAESPLEAGTLLGDGTRFIDAACPAGDVLLSGGPANIAANSVLLESFPTPGSTTSWRARIKPQTGGDNFSVVILCASQ